MVILCRIPAAIYTVSQKKRQSFYICDNFFSYYSIFLCSVTLFMQYVAYCCCIIMFFSDSYLHFFTGTGTEISNGRLHQNREDRRRFINLL